MSEGAAEAVVESVQLHRQYWSTDELANDLLGYIALGSLAVACLTRDAGVTIEVESEYLLAHLLAGTWVGEHAARATCSRAEV